jgi:uroporphyrin-III C-methyltransferase/precorrin-2 dehydrogenase/sirohydrochlorin ferrochelatase
MEALPIFVRLVGQPVLLVGDGEAADAKARLIEAAGGRIVRAAAPDVRLAFVALDDEADAKAAAHVLKAAGLLVNVVDRPALCDFTVPAIVDRSPVLVAIGTGGASATLAKALRERFEALLPAGLGDLARAIRGARATVTTRHPAPADRRRFWDAALAPGGRLDPFVVAGDADVAVAAAVAGAVADGGATLVIIDLASADPDDLTLRQLRSLNQADTLFHAAGMAPAILDRARRDAIRVCGDPPAALPPGRSIWLR